MSYTITSIPPYLVIETLELLFPLYTSLIISTLEGLQRYLLPVAFEHNCETGYLLAYMIYPASAQMGIIHYGYISSMT